MLQPSVTAGWRATARHSKALVPALFSQLEQRLPSPAADRPCAHCACVPCHSNYRTLILGLTYGYCFGVELTIDNNIASYFSDQFGKGIKAAGNFGAIFGLFNILSRPLGAWLCSVQNLRVRGSISIEVRLSITLRFKGGVAVRLCSRHC